MSAIFGIVNLDDCPASGDELTRMSCALQPHGPDAEGLWTDARIGLGQRLMCFTPEDRFERQPLVASQAPFVVISDGRLDNRPELISELNISPSEAAQMPDSAFLLRAYERWGADCRSHLIGDLAFAVYDSGRQELLIARSPFGKRSIYYYATPKRFLFSSAPKGLFALPEVPRALDLQSVADFLVWAPREPGASLYADIKELGPGHSVTVHRRGFRLDPYWQPRLAEIRFPRDEDYLEAFNFLFERVVSDYMRSASPVGIMMSGGLDSSSVGVVAAARLSKQNARLAAFTEVPPPGFNRELERNCYADETPFVEAIARKTGNIDLNFIETGPLFLLEGITPFFESNEGPFRAAWNRLWWEAVLRTARNQNVRVLLTGLPGNLTISRDGDGLLPGLIRHFQWVRAWREVHACSRIRGRSPLHVLRKAAAMFVPAQLWPVVSRIASPGHQIPFRRSWTANSIIHPLFAAAQRIEERARQKNHDFRHQPRYETPADRYEMLRRWGSMWVGRGYEALYGVQTRDPAGDIRIIEFCLCLPDDQLQRDGISRRLIRRAMRDRLPAEVLANNRRGLQLAAWFDHMHANRSRMLKTIDCFERNELIGAALDLKRLRDIVAGMPDPEAGTMLSLRDRSSLGAAFMTGGFLEWFQSGNVRGRIH